MKYQNKSLLNKAFSLIGENEGNYVVIKHGLKSLISERKDMTPKEKNALYRKLLNLANLGRNREDIEEVVKIMSKIERKMVSRAKTAALKEEVSAGRADTTMPTIFYLCSYHEKCADDHKDYQGKIYVDRYWRSALEKSRNLGWLIPAVQDYIEDRAVLTVQEVVGRAPYLISRPYCKHFFIPLNTWDVLNSSLSDIKREHPESVRGTGQKSNRQYRKERREYVKKLESLL